MSMVSARFVANLSFDRPGVLTFSGELCIKMVDPARLAANHFDCARFRVNTARSSISFPEGRFSRLLLLSEMLFHRSEEGVEDAARAVL